MIIYHRPVKKAAVSSDGSLIVVFCESLSPSSTKVFLWINSSAAGNDVLTLYNQKDQQHQQWRIPITESCSATKKIMDLDWLCPNQILAIDNTGTIWNLTVSAHGISVKCSRRGHAANDSTHSCIAVHSSGQWVATSAHGEIKCWTVRRSGKKHNSSLSVDKLLKLCHQGSLIPCGRALPLQKSPLVGGLKWSAQDGVLLAFYPFHQRMWVSILYHRVRCVIWYRECSARFQSGHNLMKFLGSVGPFGRL